MNLLTPFNWSAASLPGAEHRRVDRNNQDAVSVRVGAGGLVAVVSDGCGEGARSEVGAVLAAEWMARWLLGRAHRYDCPELLARDASAALTCWLRAWIENAAPDDVRGFLRDHLLFTLLAAVATERHTWVLGAGDGVIQMNGLPQVLEAGADNAPAYPAYRLLGDDPGLPDGRLRVHAAVPTSTIRSLCIATDGVVPLVKSGHLTDFAAASCFARNRTLLQRRLRAVSQREVRLDDDASAVLLQRAEA